MRSIVCNHPAISILVGQSTTYAAAYLVAGRAGMHFLALAMLVGLLLFLVFAAEKLAASLRTSVKGWRALHSSQTDVK